MNINLIKKYNIESDDQSPSVERNILQRRMFLLVDYVIDDMKCWLKHENTKCEYFRKPALEQGGGWVFIQKIENDQNFDDFKKSFEDLQEISFHINDKVVFAFYNKYNGHDVYFSGIRNTNEFGYMPWITNRDNVPRFIYMDNCRVGRHVSIPTCGNLLEFYSAIKTLNLEIVDDKHKNEIETYYDTLPLLKTISYLFGLTCDLLEKEITIEI